MAKEPPKSTYSPLTSMVCWRQLVCLACVPRKAGDTHSMVQVVVRKCVSGHPVGDTVPKFDAWKQVCRVVKADQTNEHFTLPTHKKSLSEPYCGWTQSCTTLKWEAIVCWYLQGNRITPGFLRWCERISSIHSTSNGLHFQGATRKPEVNPHEMSPSRIG